MNDIIFEITIEHVLPYRLVKHLLYSPDISQGKRNRIIMLAHKQLLEMSPKRKLFFGYHPYEEISAMITIVEMLECRTPIWKDNQ